MVIADMEVPVEQLGINASCMRIRDDSTLPLEERCEEGLTCQIDPQWISPDDLEVDESLELGQGRCLSEVEVVMAQEVGLGQACDTEAKHFTCAESTFCFDPTEVSSMAEAQLLANNRDGACYVAHPILSANESREIFLSSG